MKPEDIDPMIATIAAMQKQLAGYLAGGEEKQFLDLITALRGIRNRAIVNNWETARRSTTPHVFDATTP